MDKIATACEALIRQIIDLEWDMFSQVKSQSEAVCQRQPGTFRRMRWMSHCVLPSAVLQSYRDDLKAAQEAGRNLMTEKYARMQGLLPPRQDNPLIEDIVEVESGWLNELIGKYPRIFTRAQASFCHYARSELGTYSEHTIELYCAHVKEAEAIGRNLVRERYTRLFGQMGIGTIEDVDRGRAARG